METPSARSSNTCRDAPDFFREGMGQIEALDYPPQVREVMQRYFEVWCVGQRLH